MSTISVIGTGYLGATHAAAMAELGANVIGIDTNADKVAALNAGTVPFYEPGLPELVSKNVEAGRLRDGMRAAFTYGQAPTCTLSSRIGLHSSSKISRKGEQYGRIDLSH